MENGIIKSCRNCSVYFVAHTLGVPNENENVILVTPEKKSPLGAKLF
jgi:hypothetical protein